jgi:signal transduction histidine kinase
MGRGAIPEDSAVEVAAREWRRKAVHVFSSASAVAYLPPAALMVAGQSPPYGWPAHVIVVVGYLCFAFCALMHRTSHRTRAWVLLAGGYVTALIHLITIPQSPFGLALPVMLPILAIVFLGTRAGQAATGVSIGILLIGPLLQRMPGLVEMLTLEPAREPTPLYVVLHQGLSMIALLVGQMILLDRFHDFLMRSLADLQRESGERAVAYSTLQREMLERRRLENEVARAGDEERRRLGIDIHDGVCQQLTGALLRCEAMARRRERGEPLASEEFAAVSSLLEEAIDEAHAVAKGLYPLEPDAGALAAALRMLAKRTQGATGVPCRFTATGDVSVPDPETAQHLYRIAQEAVSNAARHAHARRIAVELHGGDDGLLLQVEDDGDGLPVDVPSAGMGLRTMAYRARLLDGQFTVTPAGTGGTRVSCRVPRAGLARPVERPQATLEASHAH